jgi:hypothetical protein
LIILLSLCYKIDKHASVFALFADEPRKFIRDRNTSVFCMCRSDDQTEDL